MKKLKTIYKNNRNLLYVMLFILIVSTFFFLNYKKNKSYIYEDTIQIKLKEDLVVNFFIADEAFERYHGLSILDRLEDDQGMLFIFDESGVYPFWMKDMKFSIDIIWLDENNRVVFVKENAKPSDYPESYNSNIEALYVLEFNSGFILNNNIKIGDVLNIE